MTPPSDQPTMLLQKSTLATILIGGAITIFASIFIIGGTFAHSINDLSAEYLRPMSKAVLEKLPLAPALLWGLLLASPAFVLARLGLLIWTAKTSETYHFSPSLLSFMVGLLSLPIAILLFSLGILLRGQNALFRALISFGFAVGMTLPILAVMSIVVPIYIRKGNEQNAFTYAALVALSVGMELLWLTFLESSLGSQSL